MTVQQLKEKIFSRKQISKPEAMFLTTAPMDQLCPAANEIRKHFCGNSFDICTIINAKSGKCSEDCKFCAQSSHYHTSTETYPLLDTDKILEEAKYNDVRGVLRYGIVTSGKNLTDAEVDKLCNSIRAVTKETSIQVCVSCGLLTEPQFQKIKRAGATRVHNNLESSPCYFQQVCTTHTTAEKVATLKAAKRAGLSLCSGGIMGMGETMEDRIDMVLLQRKLGIKSIPVNMLNPIPGTPYAHNQVLSNEEMCRTVAIFRFLIPDASIRLAGGRGLLPDKGEACFRSGANAAISGDMLTTSGYTIESDLALLKKLGYEVKLQNE